MQHELHPLFALALAATACAGGQDASPLPNRAADNVDPSLHESGPLIGLAAVGTEDPAIGRTPTGCGSDCEPPINEEPAPPPPRTLFPPSPLPEACPGGPAPSILTLDAAQDIGDIAMSSTHIYWTTSDAIHRRSKAGGADEVVTSLERWAGPLLVVGNVIFYAGGSRRYIFRMPADGSAQPVPLADDLATPAAWTVANDRLYYMARSAEDAALSGEAACEAGYQLKSVPTGGGEAEVLAEHQGTLDQLAADATGVYWSEAAHCEPPGGKLDKYSFATGAVSVFTHPTGIAHNLRAAGGRLLWVDAAGIWSTPADVDEPTLIAHPPLVRALATDGAAAYWAASEPTPADPSGPFSPSADVFTAPLAGGAARKVACQIYGIDEFWFIADKSAVYYRSWIHDLIGSLPTTANGAEPL